MEVEATAPRTPSTANANTTYISVSPAPLSAGVTSGRFMIPVPLTALHEPYMSHR